MPEWSDEELARIIKARYPQAIIQSDAAMDSNRTAGATSQACSPELDVLARKKSPSGPATDTQKSIRTVSNTGKGEALVRILKNPAQDQQNAVTILIDSEGRILGEQG